MVRSRGEQHRHRLALPAALPAGTKRIPGAEQRRKRDRARFSGQVLEDLAPDTCAEMDDGYEISKRLSGAIPIGDDGGGRVLLFFDGKSGPGLYRAGYGDLDPEDAEWVAGDLEALLSTGTGMENL